MDTNFLISIVVPVYKVEEYLERCILSIIKQTYKEFELILVDDGSPDTCPMLCDEWCKKDDRIIVVHKENGGLSDARNAGLKVAKGDFIVFIDSDDWISPFYLEYLLETMKETEADVVECEIIKTDKVSVPQDEIRKVDLRYTSFNTEQALKSLIEESNFHQYVWNKLYKRTVISNILFEKNKVHEDEFWTYQVFGNTNKVVKLNAPLYYYYQRDNSIMGNKFSIKRLDAIEAKVNRQYYIEKYFKDLRMVALVNLSMFCIYQGQMILLNLKGEELLQAKEKLNLMCQEIHLRFKDLKKEKIGTKLWIACAKLSFWNTCKIRNFLRKGL